MNIHKSSPRGQALVIIALAIVGLVGFTALAIDGGNVFSDRRHSQNASDTAALAAALAKVRGDVQWKQVGILRAEENGYNNDADSAVEVYLCSEAGATCTGLPLNADRSEYIQVRITSTVKMFFAPVVGWRQVTNRTEAITRVTPMTITPLFDGNAVVGLSPEDCKAVVYQGNADTTIVNSGIFVNSNCSSAAFFNNSSAARLKAPCLTAVGNIQYNPGAIDIPSNCIKPNQTNAAVGYPPNNMVMPNPTCSGDAVKSGNTLSPGRWTGQFPPSGVTNLQSGIYCVSGDFRVNGGDTLIGQDVVIRMDSGDVTWNGGATIKLDAPDSGDYKGLLLFVPLSNSATVTLNGNSESKFVGTILAPASDCRILGTGGAEGMRSQVICYKVDLSGASNTTIVYNSEDNFKPMVPPAIWLTK